MVLCKGMNYPPVHPRPVMSNISLYNYYYHYRVVLCKGMNYPPVHPRPVMSNISLSIPLCDLQTEKSEVEVSH